jgi:hypothetical protein
MSEGFHGQRPHSAQAGAPIELDDLVEHIANEHDDPLDRLAAATRISKDLEDLGERVVTHFLIEARRAGASWLRIGKAFGVSKQAVQKRFKAKLALQEAKADPEEEFEAFTQRACNVVAASRKAARQAGHREVGLLHLVLGMLAEPKGLAAQSITTQGFALEAARQAVQAALPAPQAAQPPEPVPFSEPVRKILKQAVVLAAPEAGLGYVGTEHIMLAMIEHAAGQRVLVELGIDPQAAKTFIIDYHNTPATPS